MARRTTVAVSGATAKYVVKGADIWCSTGRVKDGEIAELTPSEARHFTASNRLAPWIPDESETEESIEDEPDPS
jgi:hypothetical protein